MLAGHHGINPSRISEVGLLIEMQAKPNSQLTHTILEGVIEDESANVVFTTIFDNKIAPVGELVAEVHLPQLSNFSNDSCGVLLDPLGPNRGPVAAMIMRHRHDYASSKGDL
jgi:hypothetical protein